MRRAEDFKSENRRAYKREYSEGNRRENGENIYRELTREGQRFCAVVGLLEEIVVLAAFGIRVSMAPVPVLVFLWVLFVILTAAVLIGASCLSDRIAGPRPAAEGGRRCRCVNSASAGHVAAAGRYARGTERVAA